MLNPSDLISDDYRKLNEELHASQPYGQGGSNYQEKVEQLIDAIEKQRLGTENEGKPVRVLDYGCGKGTLGWAFGNPDWFYEYDPAVPGKEKPPEAVCDIVVCTDVLEHIEPDRLDAVLKHINACSRNLIFFVISTRPAEKNLPDGRNAHISLHTAQWWREKLENNKPPFLIAEWNEYPDGITVLCSGTRELLELISKSAVSDTMRYEQALVNCKKTPNRVKFTNKPHDGLAILVCYGPSLHQSWPLILREKRQKGAKVISVSGSHDFLISRGIIPDIHMDCDPREHKGHFTKTPHPDVEYQMASCLYPTVIDNLLANKLSLWHVYNSQEDLKIIDKDGPDPTNVLIGGGGSIGCRAFSVLYAQGFRQYSIYGFDCCFGPDGSQHAGDHSGKKQHQWTVKAGDRWFYTSGNLLYVARSFISSLSLCYKSSVVNNDPIITEDGHSMEVYLHGNGLLQHLYQHPGYDPKTTNWINGDRVEVEELMDGNGPDPVAEVLHQGPQASEAAA